MVKKSSRRPPRKNPPLGIKLISTWYFLNALAGCIFGLVFLTIILTGSIITPGGTTLFDRIAGMFIAANTFLSQAGTYVVPLIIAISIVVAIGATILGILLWRGNNIARIIIGIFAIIGIITNIVSIINGQFFNIIQLVINGLITWYLFFDIHAKKFFKK